MCGLSPVLCFPAQFGNSNFQGPRLRSASGRGHVARLGGQQRGAPTEAFRQGQWHPQSRGQGPAKMLCRVSGFRCVWDGGNGLAEERPEHCLCWWVDGVI